MTINEEQDAIIEEFELFSDWMDKYENIIHIGKELPPMDEALKTDDRLIKGCQSRVWLSAQYNNSEGKIYYTADSDAFISKGLIAMIIRVLSGQTPKDIVAADLYFVDTIGLTNHLSASRSNGLLAMLKQIIQFAKTYYDQEPNH